MIQETRKNGKAAERYAEFVGKHVIIYYRDMRDTDRRLHGVITEVEGDLVKMENGEWQGSLNVRHARALLVSTVAGWNKEEMDCDEKRGLFSIIFKR